MVSKQTYRIQGFDQPYSAHFFGEWIVKLEPENELLRNRKNRGKRAYCLFFAIYGGEKS